MIVAIIILYTHYEKLLPSANSSVQNVNEPKATFQAMPSTGNRNLLYKIWVSAFRDSNSDGVGDINGIVEKLDYLKTLGVSRLQLSPIFSSPAYHGYEVSDYRSIESKYGTMQDFDVLIESARKKGIEIILDIPINHTSDQHPWFLGALGTQSQYADYYIWQDVPTPSYGKPWGDHSDPLSVFHTKKERNGYYYGVFGYHSPDLNFENPKVVDEFKNIFRFWINKGVKGFRIDAARYLIETGSLEGQRDTKETLMLLNFFNNYIKSISQDSFFIGEVFASTEVQNLYFCSDKILDYLYNFEFGPFVLDLINNDEISKKGRVAEIKKLYQYLSSSEIPMSKQYVFYQNHDLPRINIDNLNKLKLAYSLLLTSPFQISLYYGEENGQTGFSQESDLFYRDAMIWSDDNIADPIKNYLPEIIREDYLLWKSNREVNKNLFEYINSSIRLRQLAKVYDDHDIDISLDLSNESFIVYSIFSKNKSYFAIINPDVELPQDFNVSMLPPGSYKNIQNDEFFYANEVFKVLPGEFILIRKYND
ncbi:alpha-amylase family glycosyl hydrolase [Rheinheimera oceanensis]|uniref:alpha-amylase family glycosyl hydrolase n=1 Tax=Rheinheimera oceanensis TaxID=2817449 RepID=UPI001BFE5199